MTASADSFEVWAIPEAAPEARRKRLGAVRALRFLFMGSVVIPVVLGLYGAYASYRATYDQARTSLTEAAAVAEQNTAKILDTHVLVAARIGDLLANLPDSDIRSREQQFGEQISRQLQDVPQVAAAWVIDAEGHALVSGRVYPVNQDIDHSKRDDFRRLKEGGPHTFIWALRARSLQGGDLQPYFTVSRRREASDGRFLGIIVVAVSGDYFVSFYNSLLGGSTDYKASVLREDGTSLASFPESNSPVFQTDQTESMTRGIAALTASGATATSTPTLDGSALIAYKRLANYPVYVAVGRAQASIFGGWLWSVAGYAAIGVPAAVGFMLLSLLALRRTLSEQFALNQAHNAAAQQAAVEAELYRAQQVRAVELAAANEELTHTVEALEAARAAAEAASQAKSEFLAHMSHELRTPLNAIIGFSDVIQSQILGPIVPEMYVDYAADIHLSGVHLLDIINGILDLVRYDANTMELHEEFIDIEEAVDEAIQLVGVQAVAAQVSIRWPGLVHAAQLYCDRTRVRQILLHILSNAVKFTQPGGSVGITVRLSDGIELVIEDNGVGISQEDLPQLMTPFTWVGSVYSREKQGAGLGLSLTKALVERHGGRIALESETGVGTTVRLWLPPQRLMSGFHIEARSLDRPAT